MATKNVEKQQRMNDDLDVLALLEAAGIQVSEVLDAGQEIGDGWQVIDKADLVGVPFVMTDYRFSDSKEFRDEDGNGIQFLIVKCITQEFMQSGGSEGKWVFTDGSTGVCKQVGEWITKKGVDLSAEKVPALVCKKGLIVSEYDYTDEKGRTSKAKTYYLP